MAETLIPMAIAVEPYTPPSLEKSDPKVVFHIRTPSARERDTMGTIMWQLGLRNPTQEIIRATLIDEIYALKGDELGDQLASELDGYWQSSKTDALAYAEWQEQELERQKDISNGAPHREPAKRPIPLTPRRLDARMKLLVDEMMQTSERLKGLQVLQMEYALNQSKLLFRIGVERIEGLPDLEQKVAPTPVQSHENAAWCETVRALLADDTWEQLTQRIDSGYRLEEAERKNSGSPRESGSSPSGSPEPRTGSETSDGSLTGSNIEPAPTGESASTIATP